MTTALMLARMQNLPETFRQTRSAKNFREEQKCAARVFVLRDYQEAAAEFRIGGKLFGAGVEPGIDLGVDGTERGLQFWRVAFRVVDEKTWIDAEETRQQRARAVREVRPRAALDLREVGLAKSATYFALSLVPVGSSDDQDRAGSLLRSGGNGACCRESWKNSLIAICK
jgi:hypothetical protein